MSNRSTSPPISTGYTPVGVYTPEQFWPEGITQLTFGQSVSDGVTLLNAALVAQLAAGNSVVVFGYSQSASIATIEMRNIAALPSAEQPRPGQLSFVMIGDPNNPDGGIIKRFSGLYIPFLNVAFDGATPSDFAAAIYSIQYDPITDFPQYPIDVLADVNALLGFFYLHGTYPDLTATQLATATLLPTSPGYDGDTKYYLIPTKTLPLLEPLIQLGVPAPIIDLIQPVLKVLVDLAYTNGYANVPTPAGLFPSINPIALVAKLFRAVEQGIHDALVAATGPPPASTRTKSIHRPATVAAAAVHSNSLTAQAVTAKSHENSRRSVHASATSSASRRRLPMSGHSKSVFTRPRTAH